MRAHRAQGDELLTADRGFYSWDAWDTAQATGAALLWRAPTQLDLPVVGVHHLAGHIESIFLEHGAIELPVALTNDIKPGDSLEVFEVEERERVL